MKILHNNISISYFVTKSFKEFTSFIQTKNQEKTLNLSENNEGIYYYCLLGDNSLTQSNIFSITFSSDYDSCRIQFLIWQKLFVLANGLKLYFIECTATLKASFNLSTPLIGIHITKSNNLLILEEAGYKLISYDGTMITQEDFSDIVENFYIKENFLVINVNNKTITIELI